MRSEEILRDFRILLEQVVGSECWSVVAGEGAGSAIMLDIGAKVPHKKEIKNKHLSEEQRKFKGEFVLYVTSVWRLDSAEEVVCGAWDDNRKGGPMLGGLDLLKGKVIEACNLCEVGMDLVLRFRGGLKLKIFCDQMNEIDQYDNYTFSAGEDYYTVGLRSKLSVERTDV